MFQSGGFFNNKKFWLEIDYSDEFEKKMSKRV